MKTDLFQLCGHCWVFEVCWHIECSTFTALFFRIWNSSTGIPSPPLALFLVMLPKGHLTSYSRMSGSRWVITPSWLPGSWRSFLFSSSVCSCRLFLISSTSVRSILFLSFIVLIFAWKVPLVSLNFLKRSLVFPILFSSVQLLSRAWLFVTPWTTARQASLSINNSHEFIQTHAHQVSDATQPSHPLSSPSPPALSHSQHQGLFKWVNLSHEVPKVLAFQHQSFQWISRVISFRMDWLDLLAVQGTLKSLLQHHSSKASILPHSAFL